MSNSRYSVDWISEVPDNWTVKPLCRIVSADDDCLGEDLSGRSEFSYVDISSVDHVGGINGASLVLAAGAPSRARRLAQRGDVIVSTVRTYLKAVAEVTDTYSDCVFSTGFAVLRPKSAELAEGYLKWAMLNDLLIQAIESHSEGLSYPAINTSALVKLKVVVPPRDQQARIVSYLNDATARIDALVTKKLCFIELLREKRQAVITHAVTKGIDSSAPMKDSGIEWLGQIPSHWDVVPASALFTESKEKAREGDEMLSATQKYGVIPLADYESMEQRQITKAITNLEIRKHVELGDFVISMRSMDGGLERARAVGSVRSSYSVLKPGPKVEGRYFGALMKSSMYIQALRLTSSFIREGQDLSFTHVKRVRLPKLGLHEQAAIADHIEAETTRIDLLISKTERSIELLKEHRTALITAAVTGKLDLREAA